MSNCHEGSIYLECINLGENSIHWDPHIFPTTTSPVLIIKQSNSNSDSSSVNAVTTLIGLYDTEIRRVYEEILLSRSAKSTDTYILQNPQQLDNMLDFLVKNRNLISLEDDPIGK